jgi:ABC-2 type transport system ATP-binding protein
MTQPTVGAPLPPPSASEGDPTPGSPSGTSTGQAPVVEADHLTMRFGDQVAVDDISLSIDPGVVLGLIGPSGCGKTTLIRMLIGVLTPSDGEVTVFGRSPSDLDVDTRLRYGYMPQHPVLFPNLSVWGNLSFVASMYGLKMRGRRRRLMELLDLVDLVDDRKKLLSECSGGMQRRLSLATTLVHDPDLLYLDEPTAGVDPILRERFWEHFRSLRDQGKTIVVPTQYVGEAVSCDLVAVMSEGRLLTLQPPDRLAEVAYGGHPVVVRLERGWLAASEIDRLVTVPSVRTATPTADGALLVVVDDLEAGTTALERHFADAGIPVAPLEALEPTFDQIFVEIIEAARAADAAAATDADADAEADAVSS